MFGLVFVELGYERVITFDLQDMIRYEVAIIASVFAHGGEKGPAHRIVLGIE